MNQDKSCESLAVVVLLTEPKYHVIISENYIHGLDELLHQLKTWGVNKKHDHLIFWKRSFLDKNVAPDSNEKANFSLEPRNDYPPPTNIFSACYKARVKRFFNSFEDAKHFRDQFRPLLPVDYFGLDVNQPIPANFVNVNADPVVASTNNVEAKPMLVMDEMDEHDAMAINELMIEENWIDDGEQSDSETEEIELAAQTDDADDFNELASNSDNKEENIAHDTENNPSNTGFESLILQEQVDHGSVEENDPLELGERANSTNEFENDDSSFAVAEANTDEHDHSRNDERNTVTEIIDDDIEITFDLRQKLLPKIQSIPMVPKINDSLSGNIPYQAILDRNDKEIERQYMVNVGENVQLVKLKTLLVDLLIRLNLQRREDDSMDKVFIKGLVIAVFSVRKVKAHENFHPDLVAFIEDLFSIRAGTNAQRKGNFGNLLRLAVVDIREMRKNN